MKNREYTLLPIEDIAICDNVDKRLDVLKEADKEKTQCEPSIYAVLTGAWLSGDRGSCTWWSASEHIGDARAVDFYGDRFWGDVYGRHVAVRPASLPSANNPLYSSIPKKNFFNFFGNRKKTEEIENRAENEEQKVDYFPIGQVSEAKNAELRAKFIWTANGMQNGRGEQPLIVTGVTYASDGQRYDGYDKPMAEKHSVQVIDPTDGKMYARVIANMDASSYEYKGQKYVNGEEYYVEILPVQEIRDAKTGKAMTRQAIIGGIRYAQDGKDFYDGNFEKTNLYNFLNSKGNWQGIGYSEQTERERTPMLTRTIPDGTPEIAKNAFNGCTFLRELRIPQSVETVGRNAFAHTQFKFISKTKNGDTILSIEPPAQNKDIVATQDISKYTQVFTNFDISSLVVGENIDDGSTQNTLQRLDMLAEKLTAMKAKLPFEFVQRLVSHEKLLERFTEQAELKGFKRLEKLIPNNINPEDLGDFYTFAYDIGCMSKDPKLNQKACTWLEERVKINMPFDQMHSNFESWKPEGENQEFSDFLFGKNAEKKQTVFAEVQKQTNWGMFLKRIYDEFGNPTAELEDGGRLRDKDGKLMFRVLHSSTNEQGEDTSKPKDLKPTIELFKNYFASKKFVGVNTPEDVQIATELSKWSGMEQNHFDRAKKIMQEFRSNNIPENIVGKHLVDLSAEIEDYKKQTEKLACAGIKVAQEIVGKLADTIGKEFTYEWLEKSDPKNFCLGLYCNCCANLAGAGYGIMRSNFVHPDIQNLVINNSKGKPVAKSTLYLNREQGYGVFNNVEVERSMSDAQRAEIYTAYKDGINAFVEEYNKQNPKKPITKISVGMNLNDLAEQIRKGEKPSEILKGISFGKYGISGQQYDGDWSKGEQYSVYSAKEKEEHEK